MPGILNEGNTCYAAAALQALACIPPLVAALRGDAARACPLTAACSDLVAELTDGGAAVSPDAFLSALRVAYPAFANDVQHDCHELLLALVDTLERSLGKDVVGGIFNGAEVTTTVYRDGKRSEVRQVHTFVELHVTRDCALQELVDGYQEEEEVGELAVTRRLEWASVVVFVLAQYVGRKHAVSLPPSFEGRRLSCVVLHSGTAGGGHYKAARLNGGQWECYNDDEVSQVCPPSTSCGHYLAIYCGSADEATDEFCTPWVLT